MSTTRPGAAVGVPLMTPVAGSIAKPAGRLSPDRTLQTAPAGIPDWVGVALIGPTPTVAWIAGYQSCGLGGRGDDGQRHRRVGEQPVDPSVRRMVALVLCWVVGVPEMTPVLAFERHSDGECAGLDAVGAGSLQLGDGRGQRERRILRPGPRARVAQRRRGLRGARDGAERWREATVVGLRQDADLVGGAVDETAQ